MAAGLRPRGPGRERAQPAALARERRLTNTLLDVELECIEGLESVAASEFAEIASNAVDPIVRDRSVVTCVSDLQKLLALRTPVAAYLVVSRAGAKPTALIGDAGLADACDAVLALHPAETFRTFGIDVPGRDSPAARRIRDGIAERTGLAFEKERAELLVRIRRTKDGWQALVRLTPRPLSTRPWRRTSVPGAVNASIAASMIRMLEPSPDDVFLNVMCGSGTIAIERALVAPARRVVALDIDDEMVRITGEHAVHAGVASRIEVISADATATALDPETFSSVAAVFPYGFRVGTHADNVPGYRAVLAETARISAAHARFALLTQELRLLEETLAGQHDWSELSSQRIWQGGHRPSLSILERS